MTDTEHDTGQRDTGRHNGHDGHDGHDVVDGLVDGARIERRDPSVPGREDAEAAARQVAAMMTRGDRLRGDLRRFLADMHGPARDVAIGLGFGLVVWAEGTLGLGWPEPRAWTAGLATAVVVALLVAVTTAVALRAEPRSRVELILAPDPGELRSGMAGSGVTRRDVEASVLTAARESRAAGHLVLDTSGATRPVMTGERVYQLLDTAISRADTLVVIAPAGMLTASMRALIRRAVRRGLPVSYWHHDAGHRDDSGRGAR